MFQRLILVVLVGSLALPLRAQWLDRKTPNAPRLPNGRIDLTAPVPKKDGKPDFTGIWQSASLDYLQDLARLVPDGIPMQPWAADLTKLRSSGTIAYEEPDSNCLPQGVPKINATPVPFKIIPATEGLIILYEAFGQYRQIFMDGRSLPPITNPTWFGYSIGKWDGDTIVIETTGFNGRAWLDSAGHPQTEAGRVTERLRRPDFGHLEMQITVDDPKAYSRPWTLTEKFNYQPDTEILEFVCLENERDLIHLKNTK
jgi:hypothetical protein